jgi:hypothetical protein
MIEAAFSGMTRRFAAPEFMVCAYRILAFCVVHFITYTA